MESKNIAKSEFLKENLKGQKIFKWNQDQDYHLLIKVGQPTSDHINQTFLVDRINEGKILNNYEVSGSNNNELFSSEDDIVKEDS